MTAQQIADELERLRLMAWRQSYLGGSRELMEGLASLIGTVLRDGANHRCNRAESWWERDAQGIDLCRVCEYCQEVKLRKFRPEILTGYTQADVSEPIEPD